MAFIRRNSPMSLPTIVIGGPVLLGPIHTSTVITNSGVLQVGDVVAVAAAAAAMERWFADIMRLETKSWGFVLDLYRQMGKCRH